MAKGTEKIPIKQSFDKNVFCCVRMGGMGVALAPLAAMEVATLMSS